MTQKPSEQSEGFLFFQSAIIGFLKVRLIYCFHQEANKEARNKREHTKA